MLDKLNAVVAGHICLDLIPGLDHLSGESFSAVFQPGRLVTVGPAGFCTGGPVSNTGLALFRLGVQTRLIAKIGSDPFGQIVRGLVERFDADLTQGLVADESSATSYSVIISPPGMDRIFLHCPGANDSFCADDVDMNLVQQASLFHFGYPPIMRRMFQDGGSELVEVFRRARSSGVTTSLDLSYPDPLSESGRADWGAILQAALPFVDIFLPSFEEIMFMLHRQTYEQMQQKALNGQVLRLVTPTMLSALGRQLIDLGTRVVVIKLGDRGLYLRTARESALSEMGRAAPADLPAWANQELWSPCFQVDVVGTTGSGDATIAGFLSALLRDLSPRQSLTAAVAVGACNVEAADALSGIRSWEQTAARIQAGWEKLPLEISAPGWHYDPPARLWVGPAD
jgi:sugar/nucleoside kinase (ribokinase family)